MKMREQERAFHAYTCTASVEARYRNEYKSVVNGFGAAVMQSGLIAALAFVKRYSDGKTAEMFLDHLARARLPGLPENATGETLIDALCRTYMDDYMLATRECLQVAVWFRRAVQAWPDTGRDSQGEQA